ncbi:HPP family protein [Vogesella oryzae]|uniref:HPP family protein n=1 Tax=Vogesella oryzae TaxID=1735285 RepID=UPI001583820E|nr:HPP family protein [Vogesella oryzae]
MLARLNHFPAVLRGQLGRWWPEPLQISRRERLAVTLATLLAIAATGLLTHWLLGPAPMLVASMGAAAVLLYVLPGSPLAQPWPLVGGHLVSATIGVLCAHYVAMPALAAGLAVALAIFAMMLLRCLHPPGGAIALNAVIGGPAVQAMGFGFVGLVAGNSLLMLLFALLLNRYLLRRPYPRQLPAASRHQTSDPSPLARMGIRDDDVSAALAGFNHLLDISREDLEQVMTLAEMHAYRRRLGDVRCRDFMTRDVVRLRPDASLQEAWRLLRHHKVRALPVTGEFGQVLGMVSLVDFLKRLDGTPEGLRERLARLLGGRSAVNRVAAIMSSPVVSVREDMHLVELVPLFAERGLHHVPVLRTDGTLVGMISQSDLIAALFRDRLHVA